MQQLETFSHQLSDQSRYACHVAVRPVEAGDEASLDRVAGVEDDRDRRGRGLGSGCRGVAADRRNHVDLAANEICSQSRQSVILALRPTVFDRDVPALDTARLVQALPEGSQPETVGLRRAGAEPANHWHWLLGARSERPSDRRATDQRDELAAQHAQDTGDAPAAILIGAWRSLVS